MTRLGVLLPSRELHLAGDATASRLVRFAMIAEAHGFDSVWAGDSLLARPRVEPLTLLAAVAGATRRVELGTAALTAPLRHPLLTAHIIASLDQISGGRTVLGLGSGFPYPSTEEEFAAVGAEFRRRADHLLATVSLWRSMWRPDDGAPASPQTGRDLGALAELPRPTQPGGPPLWLAGGGPMALRRAATTFDGWLPYPPSAGAYAEGLETVRAAAADAGREPETVTAGLYVTVNCSTDARVAREELDAYCKSYYGFPLDAMAAFQAFFAGEPEACVEWLLSYLRAGAEHVVVRFGSLAPEPHLDRAAEVLLPALRSAARSL